MTRVWRLLGLRRSQAKARETLKKVGHVSIENAEYKKNKFQWKMKTVRKLQIKEVRLGDKARYKYIIGVINRKKKQETIFEKFAQAND